MAAWLAEVACGVMQTYSADQSHIDWGSCVRMIIVVSHVIKSMRGQDLQHVHIYMYVYIYALEDIYICTYIYMSIHVCR